MKKYLFPSPSPQFVYLLLPSKQEVCEGVCVRTEPGVSCSLEIKNFSNKFARLSYIDTIYCTNQLPKMMEKISLGVVIITYNHKVSDGENMVSIRKL